MSVKRYEIASHGGWFEAGNGDWIKAEDYDKLQELSSEYIELLENQEKALMSFAYTHGYRTPEDIVKRGEELRKELEELL